MASELFKYIKNALLASRSKRHDFQKQPEVEMVAASLNREKQMVLFTLDRPLICQYLLNTEANERGAEPRADYEALVAKICNPYSGYDYDTDTFVPHHALMLSGAAAWSDPDPASNIIDPYDDSALTGPTFTVEITGEGIHHEAKWIVFTERVQSGTPHRIVNPVTGHTNSRSYKQRTLTADVDLTGAPRGLYWAVVFNEAWWSVRSETKFRVTQSW